MPTPVGPRKMKEPIGRRGSLMPGAGADDGVGHQPHRLVLADHPLVQDLLQPQQLLALALDQAGHRDAGPARDDLGDLLLGDLLAQELAAGLLLLGELASSSLSWASSCGSLP